MSEQTPATSPEPADTPVVNATPEPAAPPLVEPATSSAAGEMRPMAELEPEPTAVSTTAEVTPIPPDASVAPVQQLVYVPVAVPPRMRGNRGVGTLLAVVGTLLFAGIYAVVGALIIDFRDGDLFGPEFISFVGSAFFWVPLSLFLVGLILMVLLLNRAGWSAHVFGSLILAAAVYFGMIGILLLIANVFQATPDRITYQSLATNPWVIAAAVVAREVSIWTGLGIAARGRRVKARNVESRAAFDREQEAKRAEYAGTAAGN
jgi:hypothetical protein